MKYDIYSATLQKVLGWAATIDSAKHRASFFIENNSIIHIRNSKTKQIVKILTKKDYPGIE